MSVLNIAGFGGTVYMTASTTYPFGFLIEAFADDADPVDLSEIEIGELVMGVNGTPAKFSKPAIVPLTISVFATSASNEFLSVLMQANMVGENKTSNNDTVSANIFYPNGQLIALNEGIITGGKPGYTISSGGRLSTMVYKFAFSGYSAV